MATHRALYNRVIGKRRWLERQEAFSVPDRPGSTVAILNTFLPELIQHEDDSAEHFSTQLKAYTDYFSQIGHKVLTVEDATPGDFRSVLNDRNVSSVVTTGWGSLTSVKVPLAKERAVDPSIGRLDWLNLASMADHLKTGRFIMLQCGILSDRLNIPLGVGVVTSYSNIYADVGNIRYAAATPAELGGHLPDAMAPITQADELTYNEIHAQFPVAQNRAQVPGLPDVVFVGARDTYNRFINQNMPNLPAAPHVAIPESEDVKQYGQYSSLPRITYSEAS